MCACEGEKERRKNTIPCRLTTRDPDYAHDVRSYPDKRRVRRDGDGAAGVEAAAMVAVDVAAATAKATRCGWETQAKQGNRQPDTRRGAGRRQRQSESGVAESAEVLVARVARDSWLRDGRRSSSSRCESKWQERGSD